MSCGALQPSAHMSTRSEGHYAALDETAAVAVGLIGGQSTQFATGRNKLHLWPSRGVTAVRTRDTSPVSSIILSLSSKSLLASSAVCPTADAVTPFFKAWVLATNFPSPSLSMIP